MKTKVSITSGDISMAFPTSALETVYVKQSEVIAYFRATNNKTVRVIIDVEELKSSAGWPGVKSPGCANWVFDEISERYGEIKVKKIEVWNSSGASTSW